MPLAVSLPGLRTLASGDSKGQSGTYGEVTVRGAGHVCGVRWLWPGSSAASCPELRTE